MSTLIDLLTEWMPTQRWYAGDTPHLEHLGTYRLVDPDREASVRDVVVALVADTRTGGEDTVEHPRVVVYQVPLVARGGAHPAESGELERVTDGVIGTLELGGERLTLVDGAADPAFARALLHLVATEGQSQPAADGDPTRAFGHPMPGLRLGPVRSSRVLSGEQSNTSLILETGAPAPDRDDTAAAGPTIIIKLFRTLADGENPDVTLQTALATDGSTRVPPVVGNVSGSWSDPRVADRLASGHLAFAQVFLSGVEDAWRVALAAAEAGEDFGEAAESLGRATAETHAALARVLPVADAGEQHVTAAIAQMRARFHDTVALVPELAALESRAFARYEAVGGVTWPKLQRIHGDYHLGQVLGVPGRGWVLLDFEGEPLRPLAERNLPDCPARDVAGMLRSFDYVAGTLAMAGDTSGRAWADGAREAFLRGYRAVLPERPGEAELIAAYELDKAVYEVRYERLHRPDWLEIPLGAVRRALAE